MYYLRFIWWLCNKYTPDIDISNPMEIVICWLASLLFFTIITSIFKTVVFWQLVWAGFIVLSVTFLILFFIVKFIFFIKRNYNEWQSQIFDTIRGDK